MKCKGCGADIVWIKMYGSGKSMPVDAKPVRVIYGAGMDKFVREDGVVFSGAEAGTVRDDDPDTNSVEAYKSHFATCPAASQFRRRR